jgi:predicted dehydrogenase
MLQVAVIGAGALGRRHLESLVRAPIDMVLHVVDPSPSSREAAEKHVAGLAEPRNRDVFFLERAERLPYRIDIAVLASNARERLATLKAALELGARELLLEKVLFCRLGEYEEADQLLADNKARAWVNCARRANPRAGKLREQLSGQLRYSVEGAGWGLGCNVVHHLDELSYLSASPIRRVDIQGLDPGSIPAKRTGYLEFTGRLRAETERGDSFEAICHAGEAGDRVVTIADDSQRISISQMRQDMVVESGGTRRSEPYPMAMQSEATARHVGDIVAGRAPALPNWREAAQTHRLVIAGFLDHLRKTSAMPDQDECPIT